MKTDIDEHIGRVVDKASGAVANATRGIDRAAGGCGFRVDTIDDEQTRGTVAGVLADQAAVGDHGGVHEVGERADQCEIRP